MVKVWSWHYCHDLCRTSFSFAVERALPMRRNHSHYRLPVCMEFEPDALITDPEKVLGLAFDFFNWVSNEDMIAPTEVNVNVNQYGTHASQSVGDVVEIEGEGGGWWLVAGHGLWLAETD